MNRISILATAAVIAVVIGGIAFLFRPTSNVGPPATASPAPSASSTAAAGRVPNPLRTSWIGAPRTVPGATASARSELIFSSATIALDGSLRGDVVAADDALAVTSTTDTPCASADVGRYGWSLSPNGGHLQLTLIEDACKARSVAYAGDWYRVGCHDQNNTCWGDLDAGTYPTVNFGPRLDPALPPAANFGALEYTVPAGWSITSDHTTDIQLVHTADVEKSGIVPDIQAWIRPAANVQTQPCAYGVDPAVGKDAQALASWAHGLEALTSAAPAPITIDGKPGYMVDLHLAPESTAACDGFSPGAYLFAEAVGAAGPVGDDPWGVGIAGETNVRAIFLDLGGNRTTMILIEAPDQASFETFVDEAMPIVQSFHFE